MGRGRAHGSLEQGTENVENNVPQRSELAETSTKENIPTCQEGDGKQSWRAKRGCRARRELGGNELRSPGLERTSPATLRSGGLLIWKKVIGGNGRKNEPVKTGTDAGKCLKPNGRSGPRKEPGM